MNTPALAPHAATQTPTFDEPLEVDHRQIQVQRKKVRRQHAAARDSDNQINIPRDQGQAVDDRLVEISHTSIVHRLLPRNPRLIHPWSYPRTSARSISCTSTSPTFVMSSCKNRGEKIARCQLGLRSSPCPSP